MNDKPNAQREDRLIVRRTRFPASNPRGPRAGTRLSPRRRTLRRGNCCLDYHMRRGHTLQGSRPHGSQADCLRWETIPLVRRRALRLLLFRVEDVVVTVTCKLAMRGARRAEPDWQAQSRPAPRPRVRICRGAAGRLQLLIRNTRRGPHGRTSCEVDSLRHTCRRW